MLIHKDLRNKISAGSLDLNSRTLHVYLLLVLKANNHCSYFEMPLNEIMQNTGLSINPVRKSIKELQQKCLIEIAQSGTKNAYRIKEVG
jgi:predicted transcriptional regulator